MDFRRGVLVPGEDEYRVHADPTRIQQIVMNLATNARNAMPGGGELHFSLERIRVEPGAPPPLPEMERGEWVRLSVSDSGIGIPLEVLPHIFEPFFTTKERGLSTGLGLAQVWGIVRQHGGFVDVQTALGQGATFAVYLPALTGQQAAAPQAPEEIPSGQGERILLVEDEAAVLDALRTVLAQLGYRIVASSSGREALTIYEQQRDEIDLVLTDVVMPDLGGWTCCKPYEIRILEPK